MAILDIITAPDPRLKVKSTPVDKMDDDVRHLMDDLLETMCADDNGVGLAAPQVFESLRVIVLGMPEADPEDEETIPLTVLFNPEFTVMSEERVDGWEGCLSIPQLRGVVSRAAAVEVKGLDGEGVEVEFAAEEIFARVLQHEVDHLDGVLFLDRMEDLQTLTFFEEYQRFWLEPEE